MQYENVGRIFISKITYKTHSIYQVNINISLVDIEITPWSYHQDTEDH